MSKKKKLAWPGVSRRSVTPRDLSNTGSPAGFPKTRAKKRRGMLRIKSAMLSLCLCECGPHSPVATHLSGQFGSLDPSVRCVILDTNWRFVREQRSHLVFLLDSFWVSNSFLWDTLTFISSEFERWTQYILSFCNQRASKANSLSALRLFNCLFDVFQDPQNTARKYEFYKQG